MKQKLFLLFFFGCFSLVPAHGALNINTGRSTGIGVLATAGQGPMGGNAAYQAYDIPHENAATAGTGVRIAYPGTTFQGTCALGSFTPGVSVSWPDSTDANVRQAFGRTDDPSFPDFYDSWIGTDWRSRTGTAATLRVSFDSLPPNTPFTLTSYHFDTNNQTGPFQTSTTGGAVFDIGADTDDGVNGNGMPNPLLTSYNFSITSDAAGNASIDFITTGGIDVVNQFFVLSGFDLETQCPVIQAGPVIDPLALDCTGDLPPNFTDPIMVDVDTGMWMQGAASGTLVQNEANTMVGFNIPANSCVGNMRPATNIASVITLNGTTRGFFITSSGSINFSGMIDASGSDGGAPSGAAGMGGLAGPGGFAGGNSACHPAGDAPTAPFNYMTDGNANFGPPGGPPNGEATGVLIYPGAGCDGAGTAGSGGRAALGISDLFNEAGNQQAFYHQAGSGGGGGHSGVGTEGAYPFTTSLPAPNNLNNAGAAVSGFDNLGGGGGAGGTVDFDHVAEGFGPTLPNQTALAGGGGGGVVQIVSLSTLTFSGNINASGGDSEAPPANTTTIGGGGGAGGEIILAADTLNVAAGAALTADGGSAPANNGGDHIGGGGGGGGMIGLFGNTTTITPVIALPTGGSSAAHVTTSTDFNGTSAQNGGNAPDAQGGFIDMGVLTVPVPTELSCEVGSGDFVIEKTSVTAMFPGAAPCEIVDYTISFGNTGSSPVFGTTLIEEIPACMTYVGDNFTSIVGVDMGGNVVTIPITPTITTTSVTWLVGTPIAGDPTFFQDVGLVPGASYQFSLQMKVDADAADGKAITNCALITAGGAVVIGPADPCIPPPPSGGMNVSSNCHIISVASPDLVITKTGTNITTGSTTLAAPGDVIEYTVTLVNTGNNDAVNVQICDVINVGSFVPGSLTMPAGWSGTLGTTNLKVTIDNLGFPIATASETTTNFTGTVSAAASILPTDVTNGLIHHWDFDTAPSGLIVTDVVGGAVGELINGAVVGGGELQLDGVDDYFDMQNGLISGLPALSVVTRFTFNGPGPDGNNWMRVWSFGSRDNAEVLPPGGTTVGGNGRAYFTHTVQAVGGGTGNGPRIQFTDAAGAAVAEAQSTETIPTGQEVVTVVTFDPATDTIHYYLDGRRVLTQTDAFWMLSDVNDVNNWLGLSQWCCNDSSTFATYNDFMIFDRALEFDEVEFLSGTSCDNQYVGDGGVSLNAGIEVLDSGTSVFDFDTTSDNGADPQGWTDTIGTSAAYDDLGNDPNRGGRAATDWVARDNDQVASMVFSSPQFCLDPAAGANAISFSLSGGDGNVLGLTNISQIPAAPGNNTTGFKGVCLRRVSDGNYLYCDHRGDRTQNQLGNANGGAGSDNYVSKMWGAAELDPIAAANPCEFYTLDFIDAHNGGWGFTYLDDVTITGGSCCTTLTNMGSYTTQISADPGITAWTAFTANDSVPSNTSIEYTICNAAGTLAVGPVAGPSPVIDLSGFPISDNPLTLKVALESSAAEICVAPILEDWTAVYRLGDETNTITYQVQLDCIKDRTNLINTVVATNDVIEITNSNNSVTNTFQLDVYDLELSSATSSTNPGINSSQTLTLSVLNNGPGTAAVVIVTNVLAAGVSVNALDPNCTISGSTIICTVPTPINPTDTFDFLIDVQTPCCVDGTVTNRAVVGPQCADIDCDNNDTELAITFTADNLPPVISVSPRSLDVRACNFLPTNALGGALSPELCAQVLNITGVNLCALPTMDTGVAEAGDTCSVATSFVDQVFVLAPCELLINRVWTFTDECGNTTSDVQFIDINIDLTPPTILGVPPNMTLCGSGPITDEMTNGLVFADNCDGQYTMRNQQTIPPPESSLVYTNVSTQLACGGGELVTRTYTAIDGCGNAATAVQIITNYFQDTTGPVITVPPDLPAACNQDTSVASNGMATAVDDCGGAAVTWVDDTLTIGCTTMVARIWIATDSCGNQSIATQMLATIDDTIAPVIDMSNHANSNSCNTSIFDVPAPPAVSDDCGSATITNSDTVVMQGGNTIVLREWIATDACGNEASEVQVLVRTENFNPPVVIPPADIDVCNDDTNTTVTGLAMAFGSCCSTAIVSFADLLIPGAGPCEADIIVRTFTVSDECGLSTNGVQIIRQFLDTNPPIFDPTTAENVTLCNATDTSPAATGTPHSDDPEFCPIISVDHVDAIVSNACGEVIERTWMSTDKCGNVGLITQLVTNVVDSAAPAITPPADASGCNIDTSVAALGMATATDDCGAISLVWEDTAVTNGCVVSILRRWTGTDDCGNSAFADQTITTTVDLDAPALEIPADTDGCNLDLAAIGSASAVDACSAANMTVSVSTTTVGCVDTIVKIWTATDVCGNTVTGSQTIVNSVDTDAPMITAPANADGCNLADLTPTALGMADATDTCSAVSVAWTDLTSVSDCVTVITRTWTASDDCGNESSAVQTIINNTDTEAPVFTEFPEDFAPLCFTAATVSVTGEPVVIDNCAAVTITSTDTVTVVAKGQEIVRTWTATDACGNVTSQDQFIFLYLNTTFPDISGPADVFGCNLNVATNNTGEATSSDPAVTISFIENRASLGCEELVSRVWIATDGCLFSTATQIIYNVVDQDGPEIDVPVSIDTCDDADISPAALGMATASDQCGAVVSLNWTDTVLDSDFGNCLQQVQRDWVAVDGCGNATTNAQFITVRFDNITPVFGDFPQDIEVCNPTTEVDPMQNMPTGFDNCGIPTIEFVDDVTQMNCQFVIRRTWTVSDSCGNSTSRVHTIVAEADPNGPGLMVPEDFVGCNVASSDPFVTGEGTAIDGCSSARVWYVDVDMHSGCTEFIQRTWNAEDRCGTVVSGVQNITITFDNADPSFAFFPADTNVCNPSATVGSLAGLPIAQDDCEVVSTSFVDNVVLQGCQFFIERTWTIEDRCGKTASQTQRIISETDPAGPNFTNVPPDVALCNGSTDPADLGFAGAADGCSTATITYTDTVSTVSCIDTITRTWIATDRCGGVSTVDQIIELTTDLTPPVITAPNFQTFCLVNGATWTGAQATVTDNCSGGDLQLSFTDEAFPGLSCVQNIRRVWTATDACGNVGFAATFISVESDTFSLEVPADVEGCNIDTTALGASAPATVMSECFISNVSFSDAIASAGCVDTITRTWTATDLCGTEHSGVQTIINQVDAVEPVLEIPADFDACNVTTDPAITGLANASDDCSTPTVTFADESSTDGCIETILRTWTASDDCGNESTGVQRITVTTDSEGPAITAPADVEGCGMSTDPADSGMAEATDNCGIMNVWFTDDSSTAGCVETITRTWYAADNCGITNSAVQVLVVVNDTIAPELTINADIEGCNLLITDDPIEAADATDQCGDVTISVESNVTQSGCMTIIERVFTAEDECGNQTTGIQTIRNMVDNAPPVITAPADVDGCNLSTDESVTGTATATDSCGASLTIGFEDTSDTDGCAIIITRTWTATDGCDNSATAVQTIRNVVDSGPPTIECPSEMYIVPDAGLNYIVPDFSSLPIVEGCPLTFTQTPAAGTVYATGFSNSTVVSISVEDQCGNETTCDINLFSAGCIGDLVWEDSNGNGVLDPGEPGIAGATVVLFDAAGNELGQTVTDTNGNYILHIVPDSSGSGGLAVQPSILGLARGVSAQPVYISVMLPDHVPTAQGSDSVVDPASGNSTMVMIAPRMHNLGQDVGLFDPVDVKGYVYMDLGNVGDITVVNVDALGVANATITVSRVEGTNIIDVATTVTAANGLYCFTDLPPGQYNVSVDPNSLPADGGSVGAISLPLGTLTSGNNISPSQNMSNFGIVPAPTAVKLESMDATGGVLTWIVGDESDVLGYNIIDANTGAAINSGIILATGNGSSYAVDVGEGDYILQAIDEQLSKTEEGAITQYAEVDATPVGDPVKLLEAVEGALTFVTDEESASYFVSGVGTSAVILDVTDPDKPVRLVGALIATDDGTAAYFSYTSGARIRIQ